MATSSFSKEFKLANNKAAVKRFTTIIDNKPPKHEIKSKLSEDKIKEREEKLVTLLRSY